jgi:nucleotide-binding universal stress UspA family protein
MVSLILEFGNVKKILIPTDGSDYSMRAAEYAMSVAKMLAAEVVVVFVIDTDVLSQMTKMVDREEMERELKQDGRRYINYVLTLAEKENVKATSLLAKGRPFEQIVHLAKGLDVNLIIMGTYGRRGADRILLGSVAERVIEYCVGKGKMSNKGKVEEDYRQSLSAIESMAEATIKTIHEKVNAVEKEAVRIGERVESSLNGENEKATKKKG